MGCARASLSGGAEPGSRNRVFGGAMPLCADRSEVSCLLWVGASGGVACCCPLLPVALSWASGAHPVGGGFRRPPCLGCAGALPGFNGGGACRSFGALSWAVRCVKARELCFGRHCPLSAGYGAGGGGRMCVWPCGGISKPLCGIRLLRVAGRALGWGWRGVCAPPPVTMCELAGYCV